MVLAVLRSKKFKKNLLWALLILIIPSFVLWGVGNMSEKQALVGEIGKHKVYAEEFEKSRQGLRVQIVLSYFQDKNTLDSILQNRPMMNYMTWERLIYLDAAKKARINIPNSDVRAFLSSHPLFSRNGVFDETTYNYLLRNNFSMDARQFEEVVRTNLLVKEFRQRLLKDVTITPEETLDFWKKTNSKAELSYFLVNRDLYADKSKPSDEEVKKYYDANKSRLYSPSRVIVEYVEFPYNDAAGRMEAEKKIKDVYQALAASGDKFTETANKLSLKYAVSGPFGREEMVPGVVFFKEFNETAFSLNKGQLSQPVFSSQEKGVAYILKKKEDLPAKPLSFDEVKLDITSLLTLQKSLMLAGQQASELYNKILSQTVTFESAAAQLSQDIKKTPPVSYKDYIENAGPAQDVVVAAIEAGQGKVLKPIPTEKGILISRVDKIISPDMAEFEKNKESITKKMLLHKQMGILDTWLAENAMKVKLHKPIEEM